MANQEGSGLILGLVVGIAGLVISVIIAFIIVSTIADVEEDTSTLLDHYEVTNERGNTLYGTQASVNDTEYVLEMANITGFANPVILAVYNISAGYPRNDSQKINVGNTSVTSAGVLTNGTTLSGGWENVSIDYTYDAKGTTISSVNLRTNFTVGVDNISAKIPTVLLIAAVVLILGVLSLLWFQYQKMGIGNGSGQL